MYSKRHAQVYTADKEDTSRHKRCFQAFAVIQSRNITVEYNLSALLASDEAAAKVVKVNNDPVRLRI